LNTEKSLGENDSGEKENMNKHCTAAIFHKKKCGPVRSKLWRGNVFLGQTWHVGAPTSITNMQAFLIGYWGTK